MVITNRGDSNVGTPALYEAGDQRNLPVGERERDRQIKKSLDHNDRDNIMNYSSLMAANHEHKTTPQKNKAPHERQVERETEQLKRDPTLPAIMHGNKPSRGARIDKQLREDDEAELRNKAIQRPCCNTN